MGRTAVRPYGELGGEILIRKQAGLNHGPSRQRLTTTDNIAIPWGKPCQDHRLSIAASTHLHRAGHGHKAIPLGLKDKNLISWATALTTGLLISLTRALTTGLTNALTSPLTSARSAPLGITLTTTRATTGTIAWATATLAHRERTFGHQHGIS